MHSIRDYRGAAERRLPRMVMDFLDGGALDEITLRANVGDLSAVRLQQRVLREVSEMDLSVSVFGTTLRTPVGIAPMGLMSLFRPDADVALARAAQAAGTVFVHSAWSGTPLRDVAAAAPGSVWSQMTFWPDARLVEQHLQRAQDAGIEVLVIAADVSVSSKRDRDLRNGFTMEARPTPRSVLNAARRPRWLLNFLTSPRVAFGDQSVDGNPMNLKQMQEFMEHENTSATWRDVERIRALWPGRIVVKGIVSPDDARAAIDSGADAVYVSNHGGRQFDAQPSTVAALPAIAGAVDGQVPVLVDGGIRRGSDIVAMMALGASLCLVGRPVVYGAVHSGTAGAEHVLEILAEEASVALAFTGTTILRNVDRSVIAPT
ncbi:MAG: alpha-hydroxy acid oxidase [Actinobacteria bacterium]|nr:alpha-hydroxy acid oxidase [Actinomycetota bacterium]